MCKNFFALKIIYIALIAIFFNACKNLSDYAGFYVTKGYFENDTYMTMTIYDNDTVVCLNENNIDVDFTRNIIIGKTEFIKGWYCLFVAIKPYKDSIHLLLQHDYSYPEITTFYKSPNKQSPKDRFCRSNLDINLKNFDSETDTLIKINEGKIHHLNIGHVRPKFWKLFGQDSIKIENYQFEHFINKSDFNGLFEYLDEFKTDCFISINSDKSVPDIIIEELRKDFAQFCDNKRIIESRIKDNTIVYVK